jgi:hypothetical protein
VRAVGRPIEAGALHPSMDYTGVVPDREVRPFAQAAWKQIPALAVTEPGEPFADSGAGLLCDLELHRPTGLLLDHGRSVPHPPLAHTSSIFSLTRSQPLSLLSIARLNMARSRRRFSIWRLTRMVQTSFGFNGRF